MSDHNARQAGLTVAERTTIQAAKRLADSMGNTWLSSDLETILAAYSADARNGEGVEQSQAWRELRAALNVLAIGKMSDASRRKLAAETLKDFDNLAAPAAPAPNCDCGAASNNGVHSFDCPDAAQASAASKCTRCEYIGKCDCEPAPAAPTVATTIVIQSEGKTVWAGVRHHTWDETVYVELPAPAPAAQAVRAYAMYRTRPDENDGKEFFFCAMWHPDTIPQEGERLVKGWFVPETQQSATPAEPAPSDRQGDVECCKTCGGTGDVRDMNGEWHGYCWCGARSKLNGGKSSRTHDVPYMPANTQEAKAYVLGLEDSATPECTCPSGNGSLRHPCPVLAVEPVADPLEGWTFERTNHPAWLVTEPDDKQWLCFPWSVEYRLVELVATSLFSTPADAASEADKVRVDFHLAQNTTWYPGRGANGNGILCYGAARDEVQAPTWREAIDTAIQRERQQGGSDGA